MNLKIPISIKLMLFIAILSGALVLILTRQFYKKAKFDLVEKFGMTLEHIAITAAPLIDRDSLSKIKIPGDEKKPAFKKVYNFSNT